MSKSILWRILRGFGMFWWDFLVGDTPELFVSTVFILAITAVISEVGHQHSGAVVVFLPVLVVASLAISVTRAVRKART